MFKNGNFFIFLLFLSAFFIEGIGTYISIVGLSTLFAGSIVVALMMLAIDMGKITGISFLYKYWGEINIVMKTYMTIAAAVLIAITSTGAFGFLSGEFQKAMSGNSQNTVLIQSMTDEQSRLQKRKEEIDKQIAQLPQNNVRGRTQLIRQFDPEVKRINARLAEIDTKLPELKISTIEKSVKIGPILYVAEAFKITPEEAVKWVILTIIFVFDPFAIVLLIAGNFLIERRKKEIPPPVAQGPPEPAPPPEEKPKSTPDESIIKTDSFVFGEMQPIWKEKVHFAPPPPPKKPSKKRAKKVVPPTPAPAPIPKPVDKVVIVKPKKPRVKVKVEGDREVISIDNPPAKPLMKTSLDDVHEVADIIEPKSVSTNRRDYARED